MKTTMTGNIFIQSPSRMAGTYQIAYDVETPSGKTGTALFHYEYDKRDIVDERLITTPEIADEMREYIGDDSPCCFSCFAFPDSDKTNQNAGKVQETQERTTSLVYRCE